MQLGHPARPRRRAVLLVLLTGLSGLGWSGCAGRKRQPVIVERPPEIYRDEAEVERLTTRILELEGEVSRQHQSVVEQERENEELQGRLAESQAELASLEERYAALEVELESAIEEILRTSASVRGVGNRALAISRISEVRVELEGLPAFDDEEVSSRIERASELLGRADQALAENNFGGASYLAARSGELVRQARIVAELRSSSDRPHEMIPIVPSRQVTAVANANLRSGPGLDHDRLGGIELGEQVTAVARSGEWYQVRTRAGLLAWVHGRLVDRKPD